MDFLKERASVGEKEMKILITGGKPKGGLVLSFAKSFEKRGCKVAFFDDEKIYTETSFLAKNRYTNRLLWKFNALPLQNNFINTVEKERSDLLLIIKGWFFHQHTIAKIKKQHPETIIFSFNPDNPFNTWHFGNSNMWIRKSIPIYDGYFIWGKFLIDPLKKAGVKRVEYLPFACDPELHYPVSSSEEERKLYGADIVFVGTWDEEREWWLTHILDYPIAIWGNFWEKASKKLQAKWKGRAVIGEEFSKVCDSSKIILNFIRKQNIPAHNMKTFEIPACKGFMLTTRTVEQCEFFEEDKEIACFSTPNELREKLDYYLSKDELRRDISEMAFQKVQKHTYYERVQRILEIYAVMRKGYVNS